MRILHSILFLLVTVAPAACAVDERGDEFDLPVDASGRISADAGSPRDSEELDTRISDSSDASSDAGGTNCAEGLVAFDGGCAPDLPRNPGFDSDDGWETFGGATYGNGALELERGSICAAGGSGARQTFELGAFDETGPIEVAVDLLYDPCDDSRLFPCEPSSILFAKIGTSVVQIPTPFGLEREERTVRFCLPASAYGGESTLELWAREYEEEACTDTERRTVMTGIDAVRFESVDELTCPVPGDVQDADFEGGGLGGRPLGWSVNRGGSGQVVLGGEEGDKEAVITLADGCSNAQFQQVLSTPIPSVSTAGIALAFEQRIVDGTPLQVRFGPLERYPEPGVDGRFRFCLPPYLWGRSEKLLFRVTGSVDCTETHRYRAVIDDVEFEERAECGPAGSVVNGEFAQPIELAWKVSRNDRATVEFDPAAEAVGLRLQESCGAATLQQWTSPGEEVNALVYRYRTTGEGAHELGLRELARPNPLAIPLPASMQWAEATTCLPPEPRVPISVGFTEVDRSSPCGVATDSSLEVESVRFEARTECEAIGSR